MDNLIVGGELEYLLKIKRYSAVMLYANYGLDIENETTDYMRLLNFGFRAAGSKSLFFSLGFAFAVVSFPEKWLENHNIEQNFNFFSSIQLGLNYKIVI